MKITAIAILAAVAAFAISGTASAHFVRPKVPITQMSPQQEQAYYKHVLAHARYVAVEGRGRPKLNHLKLERWAEHRYKKIEALINPFSALTGYPPHHTAWLCIHRYEGSWTDHGAPYYGGLQMDYSFQQAYGAELLRTKGTADNWTPLEQEWVAEKAYASGRGFYPWPNTARYCGLI